MTLRNLEEGSEVPKDIPAMKIIYRIAGFEGEATENRVDRLNENIDDDKDPEKKFAVAKALLKENEKTKQNYILMILKRLKELSKNGTKNFELIKIICKLLQIASQLQAIREKIVNYNGIGILLNVLISFFSLGQEIESDSISEGLMAVLENIVTSSEKKMNLKIWK